MKQFKVWKKDSKYMKIIDRVCKIVEHNGIVYKRDNDGSWSLDHCRYLLSKVSNREALYLYLCVHKRIRQDDAQFTDNWKKATKERFEQLMLEKLLL